MGQGLQTEEPATADAGGIDQFLDRVQRLDRAEELQAATDQVYDLFDRLLTEQAFETCDRILMQVNVNKFSTSLLRSFLTITAAAKGQLKARAGFFAQVEIRDDQAEARKRRRGS